jgi:1-acyl-sn-glycerol-3-phosphate acyltransferase
VLCAAAGVRVRVRGDAPEPARPFVLVANHDSFVDAMTIILSLPEPVVFVAGSALHGQRIAGPFLRRLGCVFVGGRTERTNAVLARLAAELEAGRSLAIFPEGSLAREAGLRRFRSGAFVVAAMANRPIVPMAISGTRTIVAPGTRATRRGEIDVAIGSPIYPSGSDRSAAAELRAAARAAIEGLLDATVTSRS